MQMQIQNNNHTKNEEKNFNDAMAIFEGMSVISEIAGVIRVH